MRLPHFLDAAYATLVEEYQTHGMQLFDAMERLAEYSAGYKPGEEGEEKVVLQSEARQNEQSLQQLRAMMMGV